MSLAELLLALIVIWVAAQAFGELAERLKQPAVLGELFAGVVIGVGGLGWIDPHEETIHLLAELGVLLLLFAIGLETRLKDLLQVGGASTAVAVTGVLLPLGAGYAAGRVVGADPLLSLFLGATLTATSVGVTARVLRDLGHLGSPEARVILGAAVIDDILGLVLLALVTAVLAGGQVSAGRAVALLAIAVLFLVVALLAGRVLVSRLFQLIPRLQIPGSLLTASLVLAFGLALLAARSGSAAIIGAFAAGMILAETGHRERIEEQVRHVGHLFVPIFFVVVGAQVDLRPFNPLEPANWPPLAGVVALSAIAMLTKWAAGVAPFWIRARKNVIGVGMIPRGEVGLIFAQVGRTSGLLDGRQFSAVVMIVMITTFAAPILLRRMLVPRAAPPGPPAGPPKGKPSVEELVSET